MLDSGEIAALAGDLRRELRRHLAEHLGEIDARFLEDAPVGQDARSTAAAPLALPGVFSETAAAVGTCGAA